MRTSTSRRRRLASSIVLAAFLALPWSATGVGEARAALPFDATGTLGALDLGSNAHAIAFDTSTGRYAVDGVLQHGAARLERVGPSLAGASVQIFDFASIPIGPSVTVTASGGEPLVLLSPADAALAAPLPLSPPPRAS